MHLHVKFANILEISVLRKKNRIAYSGKIELRRLLHAIFLFSII